MTANDAQGAMEEGETLVVRLRGGDPDETTGRAIYRAAADTLARSQINIANRGVYLMRDDEQYVKVTGTFQHVHLDAALFQFVDPHGGTREAWVALRLIHGADERRVHQASRGEVLTFRVMEWKARKLGLDK